MFLHYFNLREQPFGVTPDPRFIYMGTAHQKAYSSLLYSIESQRGFMALIAPPGLGKTTVLLKLLEELQRTSRTAFVFQVNPTPVQLLRGIIADLGAAPRGHDLVELQRQFGELVFRIAQSGKRVVLAVDEAQNLDEVVLEMMRMLSNFETRETKLLQIVIAGQPQLAQKLSSPHLEQLRQRLAVVARCVPLKNDEVPKYIAHRLQVAGYKGPDLFTPEALQVITRESKGVPRSVNHLCFQALTLACAHDQRSIDVEIMQEVMEELSLAPFAAEMAAEIGIKGAPAHADGSTGAVANSATAPSIPPPTATPPIVSPTVCAAGAAPPISTGLPSASPPVVPEGTSPADSPIPAEAPAGTPPSPASNPYLVNPGGALFRPPARPASDTAAYANELGSELYRRVYPEEGVSEPPAGFPWPKAPNGSAESLRKPIPLPMGGPPPLSGVAAGPSSGFPWPKAQTMVLGGEPMPPPGGITPQSPEKPHGRSLSLVLTGLLMLLVGIAASPWIKSGFMSSDRQVGNVTLSPMASVVAPSAPLHLPAPVFAVPEAPPLVLPVNRSPARAHAPHRDFHPVPAASVSTPAAAVPATPKATAPALLASQAGPPPAVPVPAPSAPAASTPTAPAPAAPTPAAPAPAAGPDIRIVGALENPGRLIVQCGLPGARIAIDGQHDGGWLAPHVFTLAPGPYAVSVIGPHGETWHKTVEVEAGQEQFVTANFEDGPRAHLTVDTDPAGVMIMIDGQPYGESHVDVMLAAGWHECKFYPGKGLRPIVEKFQLKPGEALTKRIVLSNPTTSSDRQ